MQNVNLFHFYDFATLCIIYRDSVLVLDIIIINITLLLIGMPTTMVNGPYTASWHDLPQVTSTYGEESLYSGGSKGGGGGAPGARSPLRTKIFPSSCSVSENLVKIICWRPRWRGLAPPPTKILDPPLLYITIY